MTPVTAALLVLFGATPLAACRSEQGKQCQTEYASAQETVRTVDGKSIESLERSVAAIDGALAACRNAGSHDEVSQLTTARNEIGAHLKLVQKRSSKPKTRPPSPEELLELEKNGDPNCPAGQGYKHRTSGKDIRCTGPQLVDMSLSSAERYLAGRAFKITKTDNPPELTAEYGAELFKFRYASSKGEAPPRCVTIYPPPGTSWQEATARATGVPPNRIKPNAPLRTSRGELALHVDESPQKLIIRIGACGG
jgi:hypothetical protein